jgi:Zn-dependent peptidase ImmA (M78 family)/DNA-binding XRE family transcriptional regulator
MIIIEVIMFGKKLSELREVLNISQKQVASILNIAQETVSKIESGKRALSSYEIFRLSKELSTPIGYFFGEVELNSLPAIRLRAADALCENDRKKIAILKKIANSYYDIDLVLKKNIRSLRRIYSIATNERVAIAEIALEERTQLGFDDISPIKNLNEILMSNGLKVIQPILEFAINGMFLPLNDNRFLIVINSDNSPAKRNFTLAHEYGHYLIHRNTITESICINLGNPEKLMDQERVADQFAVEFLIPVHSFDNFRLNEESFALYMHNYKVSREALTYRLYNLGKINDSQKRFLLGKDFHPIDILARLKLFNEEVSWFNESKKVKRLSPEARRLRKHLNATDIISSDYRAAVVEAYEKGVITYKKAAEYLFVDEIGLSKIISEKERNYESVFTEEF